MARYNLPIQSITRAGLSPTKQVVTTADDAEFVNSGNVFVVVENTDTVNTMKINFPFAHRVDGVTVPTRTVTVPVAPGANTPYVMVFGPFDPSVYNTPTGTVLLNASGSAASLRVSVMAF